MTSTTLIAALKTMNQQGGNATAGKGSGASGAQDFLSQILTEITQGQIDPSSLPKGMTVGDLQAKIAQLQKGDGTQEAAAGGTGKLPKNLQNMPVLDLVALIKGLEETAQQQDASGVQAADKGKKNAAQNAAVLAQIIATLMAPPNAATPFTSKGTQDSMAAKGAGKAGSAAQGLGGHVSDILSLIQQKIDGLKQANGVISPHMLTDLKKDISAELKQEGYSQKQIDKHLAKLVDLITGKTDIMAAAQQNAGQAKTPLEQAAPASPSQTDSPSAGTSALSPSPASDPQPAKTADASSPSDTQSGAATPNGSDASGVKAGSDAGVPSSNASANAKTAKNSPQANMAAALHTAKNGAQPQATQTTSATPAHNTPAVSQHASTTQNNASAAAQQAQNLPQNLGGSNTASNGKPEGTVAGLIDTLSQNGSGQGGFNSSGDGNFGGNAFQNAQSIISGGGMAGSGNANGSGFAQYINAAQAAQSTPNATMQMVGLQIYRNALAKVSNMTLQLQPAELGRLDIKMKFDKNGTVKAHLSAEHPETLAMLQKDSSQLQRILQQNGLQMDDSGPTFDLRQQNDGNLDNFRENTGRRNKGGNISGAGGASATAAALAQQAMLSVSASGHVSATGVNIVV